MQIMQTVIQCVQENARFREQAQVQLQQERQQQAADGQEAQSRCTHFRNGHIYVQNTRNVFVK